MTVRGVWLSEGSSECISGKMHVIKYDDVKRTYVCLTSYTCTYTTLTHTILKITTGVARQPTCKIIHWEVAVGQKVQLLPESWKIIGWRLVCLTGGQKDLMVVLGNITCFSAPFIPEP